MHAFFTASSLITNKNPNDVVSFQTSKQFRLKEMASTHEIRDEHGNLIQLTDQFGNPVKLTDEHGNPIHLTGVATTATTPPTGSGFGTYGAGAYGGGATTNTTTVADLLSTEPNRHPHHTNTELRRSGSSSSSSSEDDGQGGRRRKKKGLKDKIKEKVPGIGGKEHSQSQTTATTVPVGATHHQPEHQKKGIMDKIKEKLPGHHNQ